MIETPPAPFLLCDLFLCLWPQFQLTFHSDGALLVSLCEEPPCFPVT